MNRYCLICEKEYGPYVNSCCVQGSLVCTKTEGLFKKVRKWYALNGKELTPQEMETRRQIANAQRPEQMPQQRIVTAKALQDVYEASRKEAERKLKPIMDLGSAIINASVTCHDSVKGFVRAATKENRERQEIFIFYEFIWFFMHMTMRVAFASMPELEVKRLREHLGDMVAWVAVNSYFQHWPAELKTRMIQEFYANLLQAEIEYEKCTRLDALKSLSEQVASLTGRPEIDIAYILPISQTAADELMEIDIGKLLEDFKRDCGDLPPSPYDA